MFEIGSVGFGAPLALTGLLALPLIWLLLRTLPPPARQQAFPPVSLMGGLRDDAAEAEKCPLWLRAIRMAAVCAAILGLADPILAPRHSQTGSANPILLLLDGSWAGAPQWDQQIRKAETILEMASRESRPAAVRALTDISVFGPGFQDARDWTARLANLSPRPWLPDAAAAARRIAEDFQGGFDAYWLTDGLHLAGHDSLSAMLAGRGRVVVVDTGPPPPVLRPAGYEDGTLTVRVERTDSHGAATIAVEAVGADPSGARRILETAAAEFADGARSAAARFSVPLELANRIELFQITGLKSAGAVTLVADSISRRRIALFAGRDIEEGGRLLSPLHYLRQALHGKAELIEARLDDAIRANPDAVILVDVANPSDAESETLVKWVMEGGSLLRFAGPRMAAAAAGQTGDETLFPVRLRGGGRSIGGALSWGEARGLKPFAAESPFFGLEIPSEVTISGQLLAQPGPDLAGRVLAELQDGTPLVTSKPLGEGTVTMFHTSADAEWSNLVLSQLFPSMLARLVSAAPVKSSGIPAGAGQLEWRPDRVLDAFGALRNASGSQSVPGTSLASGRAGAELPPGIYSSARHKTAVNAVAEDTSLAAAAFPESFTQVRQLTEGGRSFAGLFLLAALLLFAVDALASVWLGGRLLKAAAAAAALAAFTAPPPSSAADSDSWAIGAARQTALAYMITGDPETDAASESGLMGLSRELALRSTVVLGDPFGVDAENDELAFFPLIYWPVNNRQSALSPAAVTNLNAYLRNGGMILFDTADAGFSGLAADAGNPDLLRRFAAALDVPALQPVPGDHVLTRSFYRLNRFPGRYEGRVWVEAAPAAAARSHVAAAQINDGVTPVVVGGNDWSAAWAVSEDGVPLFSTGLGEEGLARRETAIRFGVNLVMHALSGNYKSDQLHMEWLERRGLAQ